MGGPRHYSILYNYEEIKNSKKNIVLLGEVGSGKTTLMNKLTGAEFETGRDRPSITIDIEISSSLDYNSIIFDFPGFKGLDNIIPIFKVQYRTLRNIPIKGICFVVERRDRPELIVASLLDLKDTFYDCFNNIIIIITKTDEMDDASKDQTKNYIIEKTGFDKIIFSDMNQDGQTILNYINSFTSDMEVLKEVYPKSRELLKYFKKATDDRMRQFHNEFIDDFEKAINIFLEKFDEPSTDKALKRALFFALKDYKNNIIESYYDVAKREQEYSEYVIEQVLSFSNQIYQDFEEFRIKAEKEMDVCLTDYEGENNRFKKCPFCGLIWFKTSGCNGKTKCGKRDKTKDKFYGCYKDYKVKYENGELTIEKNDINQKQILGGKKSKRDIEKYDTKRLNDNNIIEPLGCGNYISWKDMEDVTEEVNEILKNIPNADYDIKFKEICKKEEEERFENEIFELENIK